MTARSQVRRLAAIAFGLLCVAVVFGLSLVSAWWIPIAFIAGIVAVDLVMTARSSRREQGDRDPGPRRDRPKRGARRHGTRARRVLAVVSAALVVIVGLTLALPWRAVVEDEPRRAAAVQGSPSVALLKLHPAIEAVVEGTASSRVTLDRGVWRFDERLLLDLHPEHQHILLDLLKAAHKDDWVGEQLSLETDRGSEQAPRVTLRRERLVDAEPDRTRLTVVEDVVFTLPRARTDSDGNVVVALTGDYRVELVAPLQTVRYSDPPSAEQSRLPLGRELRRLTLPTVGVEPELRVEVERVTALGATLGPLVDYTTVPNAVLISTVLGVSAAWFARRLLAAGHRRVTAWLEARREAEVTGDLSTDHPGYL